MPFCSSCGAEISPGSSFCPRCGKAAGFSNNSPAPPYNPYKNPTTAALIAIIGGIFGFMGIGHIYAGNLGKGLFILIGGIVLFFAGIFTVFIGVGIVLLIIYLAIWIWQIFDARTTARKFNEHVQATGREPS